MMQLAGIRIIVKASVFGFEVDDADLTARLLEGDVDGALAEAQRMIEAGSLSPVEKKAVSARLARFFGRT